MIDTITVVSCDRVVIMMQQNLTAVKLLNLHVVIVCSSVKQFPLSIIAVFGEEKKVGHNLACLGNW